VDVKEVSNIFADAKQPLQGLKVYSFSNKQLVCHFFHQGIFLIQPDEIFFTRSEKVEKSVIFMGKLFKSRGGRPDPVPSLYLSINQRVSHAETS